MAGDPHNPIAPEGASVRLGSRPDPARGWVLPERTGLDPDAEPLPAEPGPSRVRTGADWTESGANGGRGWSDRPLTSEPPPLPVPLGAMTVTDVLDGAWAIITCRPRTVLTLTALIIVPAQLIVSLLVTRDGQGVDMAAVATRIVPFLRIGPGRSALDIDGPAIAAMAVFTLAYTVLGAALGRLVVAWYDDTDLSVRAVLAPLGRRAPALLAAWLLMVVLQGLALAAFFVPALFVIPLLLLVGPVIGVERRGPLAAIRRSGQLVKRRLGTVMWIWIVALLLERLVSILVSLAPEVLAALIPGPAAPVVRSTGWALGQFVTAPVVAGVSVLLLIDLRVRTEGLDLLVEASEFFPESDGAR